MYELRGFFDIVFSLIYRNYELLQSVPGVAELTSCVVLAVIGDPQRFDPANDGTDNAESGDGATPTTDMDAKRTPNISGPPEKEAGGEDWIIYLIRTG